jgi:hypothetical protein
MSSVEPIDAVPVLVTDRDGAPKDGAVIKTPPGRADLVVQLMTPLFQVIVRTLRTLLQSFIGFLAAGALGKGVLGSLGVEIQPNDLWAVVQAAFGLALFPALMAFLQNALELTIRLDEHFPKSRA